MRIDILTILPKILSGPFDDSILQRAQEKNLVDIHVHDLRDYSSDKHKKVDDYTFGGGAGMVMTIQPVDDAISYLKSKRHYDEIIYTTPDGKKFNQKMANRMSTLENIIIICGHYKGIDQRIRDHLVTMEISIGDYVLTGGQLAAAVITDSVVRLIPGVISDETSALTDSFQDNLLAPPVYTRPANYKGWKVPEVLLSGHAGKIDEWRMKIAMKKTRNLRPDLLREE
jgi:tRNA (guanine37-N1)-methyltransferase